MRMMPLVLVVLGLAGLCFAWWGLNTSAGRQRFDEMAGMIPWGLGVVGGILVILGVIWGILRARA